MLMRCLGSLRSPTLVFIPCSELHTSVCPSKYWSVSCDLEAALGHRHSLFIHHPFMVQDTEPLSSSFAFCLASSLSPLLITRPCSWVEAPGFHSVLQVSLTEAYVGISEAVCFQRTEPLSSGAHTTRVLLVALVVICLSPSLNFFWSKTSENRSYLKAAPPPRPPPLASHGCTRRDGSFSPLG